MEWGSGSGPWHKGQEKGFKCHSFSSCNCIALLGAKVKAKVELARCDHRMPCLRLSAESRTARAWDNVVAGRWPGIRLTSYVIHCPQLTCAVAEGPWDFSQGAPVRSEEATVRAVQLCLYDPCDGCHSWGRHMWKLAVWLGTSSLLPTGKADSGQVAHICQKTQLPDQRAEA